MRIHRLLEGDYRTVGFGTRAYRFDLTGLTLLFGRNGAGKTNILEALARVFESVGARELRAALRPQGSEPDDDDWPGNLVVELDRWTENESVEQLVFWKLLTHRDAPHLYLSYRPKARELPADLEGDLARLLDQPAPRADRAAVEAAVDVWARAAAWHFEDGDFDDRYLVASEVFGQAIFTMPEGQPMFLPSLLSSDARAAAERVASTVPDVDQDWHDDPVVESAKRVAEEGSQIAPVKDSIEIADLPEIGWDALAEFAQLVSGVSVIDGSRERLDASLSTLLGDDDTLEVRERLAKELEERANVVLPEFARREGKIEISANSTGLTVAFNEGASTIATLADLGAGIGRWVAIAVQTAANELRTRVHDAASVGSERSQVSLFLIDEPEAHLHLGAVRSVRDWLLARNAEGAGVVVATHALELLDMPPGRADVYIVTREPGHYSQTALITDTLLPALRDQAASLGLQASDSLRLARGVLVVEGQRDVDVIRHFYGRELDEHRILLLRLQGAYEALALVELEYLGILGLPLVLLLDNVRDEFIRRPRLEADLSIEEQQWAKVLALQSDPRISLELVSHGLPDIVAALPDQAVDSAARRLGGAAFVGWQRLLAEHGAQDLPLKDLLGQVLGVRVDRNFFAAALLASNDDRPAVALERAMNAAMASLAAGRDTRGG